MALDRRNLLKGVLAGAGAAAATRALWPLIQIKPAAAAGNGKRIVIVGIGGGLRLRESLGMVEGPTMPNLFGTTPIVGGFGPVSPTVKIDPDYDTRAPDLVMPAPRPQPLMTQGTLVTNLRYADGPPGHLQGHGCLLSGFYNKLENRADAHLPVPTIFELHRHATGAPATATWYVSVIGGFYRALIASEHPRYGNRYAGIYLQPPGAMSQLASIVTSGKRDLNLTQANPGLPAIVQDPAEDVAAARLAGVLDGNARPFSATDPIVHLASEDNVRIQRHLAEIYADTTSASFFPETYGIGLAKDGGGVDGTADAQTIYHAERVLTKFKPSVMAITLLDVDTCHSDFNGYLRNQQLADALVNHLWNHIQADQELRETTTMIVMPEHGRHNFFNGINPDRYGRSGIDHGQGDNGDRDVWMLALGPNIKAGQVIAPTNVSQPNRPTNRYETIDAVMTAMSVMGHDQALADNIVARNGRPGLVMGEVLR